MKKQMKPLVLLLVAVLILSGCAQKPDPEIVGLAQSSPVESKLPGVSVGSYITFGYYEQDNNSANGLEPIEWLVLDYDVANSRVLLLSRHALYTGTYDKMVCGTWEACSLRAWLNNDFINDAFSLRNQSAILVTQVDNSKSQGYTGYDTDGGNNTQDRIFLLSYAEVNKYFDVQPASVSGARENVRSRVAQTAYAIDCADKNGKLPMGRNDSAPRTADGAFADWWWLRSPGESQYEAACVSADGSLNSLRVYTFTGSIRPALWLNLDSVRLNVEGKSLKAMGVETPDGQPAVSEIVDMAVTGPQTETTLAAYKTVGDYVTFGHYEQDVNTENGPEPIEWLVLDYDAVNNRVLLLSRYALDAEQCDSGYAKFTWETCYLRAWLNKEFFDAAFSEKEQSAILITQVDNSKSQGYSGYRADGGNNTQDKIFLLSYADANKYLNVQPKNVSGARDNVRSRVAPTAYAVRCGAWTFDGSATTWMWFLRSPGRAWNYVAGVLSDGSLDECCADSYGGAVRPALWLDLNADIF